MHSPLSNTTLYGAITAISRVKKGKKSFYFDDKLADNTSVIRVVRFDTYQHTKMEDLYQKKMPIQIMNCEVKSDNTEDSSFRPPRHNYSQNSQNNCVTEGKDNRNYCRIGNFTATLRVVKIFHRLFKKYFNTKLSI